MGAPRRVDLLNCADEAIHVPGSIQPHGALIFFTDTGLLEGWSENAPAVLGVALDLGKPFDALGLPQDAADLMRECLDAIGDGDAAPMVAAIVIQDAEYDCVVHANQGRVITEFEAREVATDTVNQFAIKAHGSIDR